MLDKAQALGALDNTKVIFAAGHGESLGENGLWFHPDVFYNSVVRAPLIVSYPGTTPPGSVGDTLTRNIDFMPTVLETAAVPTPTGAEGTASGR